MAFALAWNDPTFSITQEASRVSFTPLDKRRSWELGGTGSLTGLFTRIAFPVGLASPEAKDSLRAGNHGMASPTGNVETYWELPIVGDTRRVA
jgi:hypothetical protein